MDRKTITTILAILLIGSFFMPYLKDNTISASGYEIVTTPNQLGVQGWGMLAVKYCWLLLPFAGIMLLIGALNNGRYFIGRWPWALLPIGVLAFVIIKIYRDAKGIGSPLTINKLMNELGYGFWVAFAAAVLLALYWPRKESVAK